MKILIKSRKNAFTLIEILIVIAILAILVLIAVPRYNNSRIKADKTAHLTNIRVLETAAIRYLADENIRDKDDIIDDLVKKKYIKEIPKIPNSIKTLNKKYIVTIKDGEVIISPPAKNE